MLRSCSICGKIHKFNEECPNKPKNRAKSETLSNAFRKTYKWTKKSVEIRKRDDFLCQLCLRLFEGTKEQYNYDNIQAHHIEPIKECEDLALDNLNLLSLCKMHHDMADMGLISKSELKMIAQQQEDKYLNEVPPIK